MRCFDFCFTLTKLNTTYSFVDYCVSRSDALLGLRLMFIKTISWLLLKLRVINHLTHSKLRVYALKGISREDLETLSKDFAVVLADNINVDIFKIFELPDHRTTLVLTNSLEFVVRDFLVYKMIDYPVLGSDLDFKNNFCTGKYSIFVPEVGKHETLKSKLKEALIQEFYTDDIVADSDIVAISDITYHVVDGKINDCITG